MLYYFGIHLEKKAEEELIRTASQWQWIFNSFQLWPLVTVRCSQNSFQV